MSLMVFLIALVGLLGVVVGGLVNGYVALYLERVREARASQVAARLVQDDLQFVAAHISTTLKSGNLLPELREGLGIEDWRERRELLAGPLNSDDWNVLTVAARQVDGILRWLEEAAQLEVASGLRVLTADDRKRLEVQLADVRAALLRLEPLARGGHVPQLRRGSQPSE